MLAAELTFDAPKLDYFLLSPILVVFGVAVLGVLVEAFVARSRRYAVQTVLALVGLAAALVLVFLVAADLYSDEDGFRGEVEAVTLEIARLDRIESIEMQRHEA